MSAQPSPAPRSFEVSIPIKTVSETNQREHWRARHKRRKVQRETASLVVGVYLRRHDITVPCAVTMTRVAPRSLDFDNLVSSAKACRDGIADALGIDDRDPRVTWAYAERRGKPREYLVVVQIAVCVTPNE